MAKRPVKHGVARLIGEIGEDDRVLIREFRLAVKIEGTSGGECQYGRDNSYSLSKLCAARSGPIQLPTLGGNNSTLGNINSKGEIAGATENSTRDPDCPTAVTVAGTGPQYFDYEAVVWGPTPGTIRELKPLPGDTVGMSLWINDNSQAVGASGTCANTVLPPLSFGQHAVLWDADGTAHDLGNLGSKVINMALSINNQGQVTGVSAVNDQAMPSNGTHAFLWTSAAGIQDLGTLPGDAATVGSMINDAGDVVGPSFDPSGNPRAYLWRNGVMNDLNNLVAGNSPLYLLFSTAINSYGEISGFGATEKGDVHGFLAVPIAGAAARALSANSPMVLSENVRTLVRQRLALGRIGYRLNGPR